MDNGKSAQVISRLMDMIENGQSVPLTTGKVMVNKEEALLLLRELDSVVQSELKMYRDINDRRGKIITEARKEAEEIVADAKQSASRLRVSSRMTNLSGEDNFSNLSPDDVEALRTAGDIYAASLIYTDEMLTEVDTMVNDAYNLLNNQYGQMLAALEERTKQISANKEELMASLNALSKEERYADILDLGQVLSNELYAKRMKIEPENTEVVHTNTEVVDESADENAIPKEEEGLAPFEYDDINVSELFEQASN